MSEVYYKIYIHEVYGLNVVCMQDFDERDYDQDRFLFDTKFESEKKATHMLDRVLRFVSKSNANVSANILANLLRREDR